MQNADGEDITVCPHAEMELHLKLPFQAPKMSILRRRTDDPIPDQK
jgi:hypothetical protein